MFWKKSVLSRRNVIRLDGAHIDKNLNDCV